MIIDDLRRTIEGLLGTLTPAKAQQLAKDMLEPGAAKEQVAKTTADLLQWSQGNRERLTSFIRREIAEQMKAVGGVASQTDLDAVKKRVRDLERASGMTASGRAKASSKKKASSASRSTSSTRTRSTSGGRAGSPPAGNA
jgi:polyhydroxyalkanoate synthesis regulator phasin